MFTRFFCLSPGGLEVSLHFWRSWPTVWHPQILADQLTLSQPGGPHYAHHFITCPLGFSDLATALSWHVLTCTQNTRHIYFNSTHCAPTGPGFIFLPRLFPNPCLLVENGWAHSVPWEKALNNNCFATISTQQLPPNTKMESDLFWSCIKILLKLIIDTVGLTTERKQMSSALSTYLVWNNS